MKKRVRLFLTGVSCAAVVTGCGNVTQTTKKLELGSEINVMDLVECKEGVSVSVKDRNALDIMTVGSYEVPFVITDKNGGKTEKTFTFEVVDTVAPEITSGDKLTIIKGVEFNIQELVAATDLSGSVTITSSVEVDTNTAGEYPITVTAEDTSGNKTTKDVTVTVIEREKTNFRNTVWGDDGKMIESLETADIIVGSDYEDGSFLVFEETISGVKVNVFYALDPEYGLYSAGYLSMEEYGFTGGNRAVTDYFTLREHLTKKYGEPNKKSEPLVISSLAKYSNSAGEALVMGLTSYEAIWNLPDQNTEIVLDAFSDGYDVFCRVRYSDTRYEKDYSSNF